MRKLRGKKTRFGGGVVSNQRGVVAPIVVIGLLAMLAVAGLALDGSHALGNKTRMQNAVDAAALAAAKELDETGGDTLLATAAANSLFSINASSPGNHEMNDAYGAGDIEIDVEYSLTLDPFDKYSFVHGSMPADNEWWVRVIATGFDTQTTLSRVLGIDEIPTPATAVAGPSGSLGAGGGARICNIAPIAVCENDLPGKDDDDVLRALIPKPGKPGEPGNPDLVGPGNYKLLSMYDEEGKSCDADEEDQGGKGGNCLKKNLAGAFDTCIDPNGQVETMDDEETKPGQVVGPVAKGFNTRFDRFQGSGGLSPDDYPPDQYIDEQGEKDKQGKTVTGDYELKSCAPKNDPTATYIFLTDDQGENYCKEFPEDYDPETDTLPEKYDKNFVERADEINYNYCNYIGDDSCEGLGDSGPGGGPEDPDAGVENRRLLMFPVVPCDGMKAGRTVLDVMDVACFFMLQSLEGKAAHGAGQIFGQYIHTCPAKGDSGSNPGGGSTGPLLYKIQLYKDPDSKDS